MITDSGFNRYHIKQQKLNQKGEGGLILYIEAILETQGLRSAASKGENTP
jgi:hypothetical protein